MAELFQRYASFPVFVQAAWALERKIAQSGSFEPQPKSSKIIKDLSIHTIKHNTSADKVQKCFQIGFFRNKKLVQKTRQNAENKQTFDGKNRNRGKI